MSRYRCPLGLWLIGWSLAVYLPSLGIAWAGLSPQAVAAGGNILARTFIVADWVSPGAKLFLGALLIPGMWLLMRVAGLMARVAAGSALSVLAMILDLALLPVPLSRSFGIGLTGARFDPAVLPYYVGGAAIAGVAAVVAHYHCQRTATIPQD